MLTQATPLTGTGLTGMGKPPLRRATRLSSGLLAAAGGFLPTRAYLGLSSIRRLLVRSLRLSLALLA